MSAIFKREMRSYFTSPIGYIVVILYTLLYGFFFTRLYQSGMPDMSILFGYSFTLTLFLMPVLTMRLFSEERRQKTDQALFTAPVNLSAIVLGKFFAALCVFLLAQVTTLVFELIFAFNVSVDGIGYFCCLLGSTLAASALIAVGIFISSLTESQIVAAIGGIGVSILLAIMDTLASTISVKWLSTAVGWISFSGRFNTFCTGILDYANIAFFLSFTAIFLFLTVRVQEKRRWS